MLEEPLTRTAAQTLFRRVAHSGAGVKFTEHAHERMLKWGLSEPDCLRVLRGGEVTRPAYKRLGLWRYRVETPSVTCVVVLRSETVVVVWTTWRKTR